MDMAPKPLSTPSRDSPSDETRTPFWEKNGNHDLVKSEDSSKDTVSQNPLIDHHVPCENCLPKLDDIHGSPMDGIKKDMNGLYINNII